MKYGVIDLGSNTIRLLIYKVDSSKLDRTLNIKKMNKSITHIHSGKMTQEGIQSIADDLNELNAIAKAYKADEIRCFATASLRNIENTQEAVDEIFSLTGIMPEVISGDDEAYYDYIGAAYKLNLREDCIIADVGGGSTEIIEVKNGQCVHRTSLPFGSLNTYARYVKNVFPEDKEIHLLRQNILQQLNTIEWLGKVNTTKLIGIGGTARALIHLHMAEKGIEGELHGFTISADEISRISFLTSNRKTYGKRLLVKILPDRYTTAIPGINIFDVISEKIHAEHFTLCRYGVREGFLLENMLKPTN